MLKKILWSITCQKIHEIKIITASFLTLHIYYISSSILCENLNVILKEKFLTSSSKMACVLLVIVQRNNIAWKLYEHLHCK